MPSVLIVDDHPALREGVRVLLDRRLPGAHVGEAGDYGEALRQLAKRDWDLVIVDLEMPGRDGLELLRRIVAQRPEQKVLVFSFHRDEQYALRVLRAGARGYLNKRADNRELLAAVRTVLSGQVYLSPAASRRLGDALRGGEPPAPHDALSDRELQVLRRLGAGATVGQIAAELHLSVNTVSTYRARILEKLGLRTTAEVIRYAIEAGLV